MTTKITKALVLQYGKPVRGRRHPQRMENPFWHYMVANGHGPFPLRQKYRLGIYDFAPIWCFDRMGMTRTPLPDGRTVCIGGEHEDSYDPDFYIYNDVILLGGTPPVEILGYPKAVFPPCDFHTATLLDGCILVVGALGYPKDRVAGETPMYELDLATFKFRKICSSGAAPGWIHQHVAELSTDRTSLRVRGGSLATDDCLKANFNEYALDLRSWRWELLTDNSHWRQFGITFDVDLEADSFMNMALYEHANYLPTSVPCKDLGVSEDGAHNFEVEGVTVCWKSLLNTATVELHGRLPDSLQQTVLREIAERQNQILGAKGFEIKELA